MKIKQPKTYHLCEAYYILLIETAFNYYNQSAASPLKNNIILVCLSLLDNSVIIICFNKKIPCSCSVNNIEKITMVKNM